MYRFCVTGRRNELYNVEFCNLCSEPDVINLKSRGIKRVMSGGKYIHHFNLRTNPYVPDVVLDRMVI